MLTILAGGEGETDESALLTAARAAAARKVRAAFSALGEAEQGLDKAKTKATTLQALAEKRRRELGAALLVARKTWPAAGRFAKGWGDFLRAEGIGETTAWNYMRLAERISSPLGEKPHKSAKAAHVSAAPAAQPPGLLRVGFDLRLGRFQTVLAASVGDVDTIITEVPSTDEPHDWWETCGIREFAEFWSGRCRGWLVVLTEDFRQIPIWQSAYESVGRFAFAPVPCVVRGLHRRNAGNGPASWTVYAMVARPRAAAFRWPTLPGAYCGGADDEAVQQCGKPLWLTDVLVDDYSHENDLVCDPCSGFGGTLVSVLDRGRRALGAESDQGTYDEAYRRAAVGRA